MQDILQGDTAADSSPASVSDQTQGSAPAGETAAPSTSAHVPSHTAGEPGPIPYSRFAQINQTARQAKAEAERYQAELKTYQTRMAEMEAQLQRHQAEPPKWLERFAPPPPKDPEFDDPFEAFQYQQKKANETYEQKVAALEKQLSEQQSKYDERWQSLEREKSVAQIQGQLEREWTEYAQRDPIINQYQQDILAIWQDLGPKAQLKHAVAIWRSEHPPAAPAVAPPTARPIAAPPPRLASSPANLAPGIPKPKSMSDLQQRLRSKYQG